MNLKILILLVVIGFASCFVGKKVEQFCGLVGNKDRFVGSNMCGDCGCGNAKGDCNICQSGSNGMCVSNNTEGSCGSNNSVTQDCGYKYASESLKGKPRVYKYPHYYGYGTGSGFHYGEPYYTRTVNY